MRSKYLAATAILSLTLLSGCASIISGQNQSISVETPGCEPAKCKFTNDKGTWYVTTPGTVTVRRAYGDMTVACTKEGAGPGSQRVESRTKGIVYANILYGSLLIGPVIAAGVDIGTGSAYDYPQVIKVGMACGPDAANPKN